MVKGKKKLPSPELRQKKGLFIIFSIASILIGVIYSYQLRWLGDDIFIGFRYIQNFLNGYGLVYNPGERVEGYTDFFWILIISIFSWLGSFPETTVQVLGILSAAGTVILFSIIGYKIYTRLHVFGLPFIALALALNYDFNVWSTSGLEVSFYGFLLSAAFYTFFFSSLDDFKKHLLSGIFLCLALMTRPDAILIVTVANGLLLFYHLIKHSTFRTLISKILFLNMAILVIYIPYFFWRYNYYGFLFPNTYYVKMGNETLFSKGFYYLWLYFKPHFVSFLIILLPPFLLFPLLKGKYISNLREFLTDRWNSAFLTSVIVVYSYLIGFVAKVGGDFMHARFIIPMVPYFYFIIFYILIKLYSTNRKKLNTVLTLLLLTGFLETYIRLQMFIDLDENGNKVIVLSGDVADERIVCLPDVKEGRAMGLALKKEFEGIPIKMLVRASQACLAYYTNFNYLQEYHGLTDTLIAHSSLPERGRIGHEKKGSLQYFENKGILFNFDRSPLSGEAFRYTIFNIPPFQITTELITYNNKIMDQLVERLGGNIQFVDFRIYLDSYIKDSIPESSYKKLKTDYEIFYLYYFKHNNDKVREGKFNEALKRN